MNACAIERTLNRLLQAAIAAKLAAVAVFVVTLVSVTPAVAEKPAFAGAACRGENLLDAIQARDPEAITRMRAMAAATPNGEGLLWRVEKDGAVSHLFGTMHVADRRATSLPDAVEDALKNSAVVALEIGELGDPKALQAASVSALPDMIHMDGTTLDDVLAPDDLKAVRKRTEGAREMPWEVTRVMRPWAVMGALALPVCEAVKRQNGVSSLDEVLAERARSADVPVVGLETFAEQAKFMVDMPDGVMRQALLDVVRMGEHMDDLFETMLALYEEERIALMWTMTRDPALGELFGIEGTQEENRLRAEGYAAFQAKLLDERNRNMAERAQPYLEKGGAFVAVGALHLPGEEGLVALLRKRGWTVTRVK